MKTLLTVFLLCFSLNAMAATDGNYLDMGNLTDVQKAEIALQAAKLADQGGVSDVDGVLKQLSKFEGIGRETGIAVREGLTAVVDVADKFGKTNVGQITIAMIVWRVAGSDLALIFLGVFVLSLGIWFFHYLNKTTKIVTKWENIPMFGGAWVRKVPDEVEVVKRDDDAQAVGVIGLLFATIVFVFCIANVG